MGMGLKAGVKPNRDVSVVVTVGRAEQSRSDGACLGLRFTHSLLLFLLLLLLLVTLSPPAASSLNNLPL